MITSAEQHRKLVAKLESINPSTIVEDEEAALPDPAPKVVGEDTGYNELERIVSLVHYR